MFAPWMFGSMFKLFLALLVCLLYVHCLDGSNQTLNNHWLVMGNLIATHKVANLVSISGFGKQTPEPLQLPPPLPLPVQAYPGGDGHP